MRVLLLNYEFPPLGGGGATASAQIARHLAQRGVQVVVLTSRCSGLPRWEARDGYGSAACVFCAGTAIVVRLWRWPCSSPAPCCRRCT